MQYIIVDMEFNNLRDIEECYPNFYTEYGKILDKAEECPNEIIEIGAVKLDGQLRTLETLKLYIKPTIFPIINPKVKEITGIGEEDLKEGIPFLEAIDKLRSFIGEDSILCSWAKDDVVELIRNANYYKYGSIEWISSYLDIQEYCTKVLALNNSISLRRALDRFRVKVDENKLHDALNDSVYTAEVFRRCFNSRAVKNYIVEDINQMPAVVLRIDENFKLEEGKTEFRCPRCKREVNFEYPLRVLKWRFVGVGYCERCKSNIMQEIVIKKNLVGEEIYKNTNKILNDEEYRNITGRLEKIS
ncbi:exonuclease domain-containing protein [Clostridium sp. A1-XYC3]|uniref:Exonuclease domain-containing protein n=1 Tax=Clostridium tanneri TaxID=3037988 RepID=A0ABU4JRD8_9CLOT|nr:3'-5' exonuclease [Clostridium sp. A1-XYC3]MDW8800513.1 exonuclease domain-containing protein [Clostridium sp. A1-XYC3]